jgi:YARHG domain
MLVNLEDVDSQRAFLLAGKTRTKKRRERCSIFHPTDYRRSLMKRTITLLVLLACWMIFSASAVLADGVTVYEVSGKTIIPVQENNIRMANETVRVKDEKVTATFTFKNVTDKQVAIKMGFPFKIGEDPLSTGTFGGMKTDLKFIVKVNKSDVPATKMAVADAYRQKTGEEYDFMYTWPIVFQPKEKKVVECSYNVQWGDDLGLNGGFSYIAKTGSLWKSTLDYADFYIELSDGTYRRFKSGRYNFKISPPGYKLNGQVIEWHFTNWKPNTDFIVSYDLILENEDGAIVQIISNHFYYKKKTYDGDKRYYTIEDIEGYTAPPDELYGRFYLKVLRNEIYARHGKIFKSENLQRVFRNQSWYKPDPNFSESMLNEYEKANVDFILNYEKKRGWQ